MNELNVFNILNSITTEKLYSEEEVLNTGFDLPLLIEWLTKIKGLLPLATYFKNELLTSNSIYSKNPYFAYLVCKGKIPNGLKVNWIKANKKGQDKININEDLVKLVKDQFPVEDDIAKDYIINFLSKEYLEDLWLRNMSYKKKFPTLQVNKIIKARS